MLSGPKTSTTVKQLKMMGNSSTTYINRKSHGDIRTGNTSKKIKRPMSSKPLLFSHKKLGRENSSKLSLGKREISP